MKYRARNTVRNHHFHVHRSRILKELAVKMVLEMKEDDMIKLFNIKITDPETDEGIDDGLFDELHFQRLVLIEGEINVDEGFEKPEL